MGEGKFRKPQRRGRRPGGKTGRRLGGQGAGFVLRDHEGPGRLREASGGRRTDVWEGQRDGVQLVLRRDEKMLKMNPALAMNTIVPRSACTWEAEDVVSQHHATSFRPGRPEGNSVQ